jgi:hypothetical protein
MAVINWKYRGILTTVVNKYNRFDSKDFFIYQVLC